MNDLKPDDPSRFARERLTRTARRKDHSTWLFWTVTASAALLFVLLVLALLDYWLILSVPVRWGGASALIALVVLGFAQLLRSMRRPTPIKEAALDVESKRPELGCEVSTAAEYLAGERKPSHEYEPELVSALEAKAAQDLQLVDLQYRQRALVPLWMFAGLVVCLLLFVAFAPVGGTALTRAALPFAGKQYTEVEVQPGNTEVPVGSDLDITNVFTGRQPRDPVLHWRETEIAEWQAIPLVPSEHGAFLHTLRNLRGESEDRVTGSDAASPIYVIKTYNPPKVTGLNIQITYPDYTRREPASQQTPEIHALRGSSAALFITPSVQLTRATLRFPDSSLLEMQKNAGDVWSTTLLITNDTRYWIELVDENGRKSADESSSPIIAVADEPPRVEILEPHEDIRADSTNAVPIKISVADDLGITDAVVVYHRLGQPPQTLRSKNQSEANGELLADFELDLNTLGLKEHELVAYYAEAKDNNSLDGPGIGHSTVRFIEITGRENDEPKSNVQDPANSLLATQKQIIAETMALAPQSSPRQFSELAKRQAETAQLAKKYLDALSKAGVSESAIQEMDSAVRHMAEAALLLSERKGTEAIPAEEIGLAHLYQVVKQMPDLQNLPVKPQFARNRSPLNRAANDALQAIRNDQGFIQVEDELNADAIEEALEEARKLSDAQASLNSEFQKALKDVGNAPGERSVPASDRGAQLPDGDNEGSPDDATEDQAPSEPDELGAPGQNNGRQATKANQQPGKKTAKAKAKSGNKGKAKSKQKSPAKAKAQVPKTLQERNPQNSDEPRADELPVEETDPAGAEESAENDPASEEQESESASEQDEQQAAIESPGLGQQSQGQAKAKGQAQAEGQGQGQGQGEGQQQGQVPGQAKGKGQAQAQFAPQAGPVSQPKSLDRSLQPPRPKSPVPNNQNRNQNRSPGAKPGKGQIAKQSGQQPPPATKAPDATNDLEQEELAESQDELAQEAMGLAQKLQDLLGKSTRVGNKAGQSATHAAAKLAAASQAIKEGNFGAAGVNGYQGEAALDRVVEHLAQVLNEPSELKDVADEEAPKEFEGLISEYLKRLSHAE